MRLRSKLLLAQVPLAVALVVVGFMSRSTIGAMDRASQGILKDNYQSVLAAQHMRDAADAIDRIAGAQAIGQRHADAAEIDAQRAAFDHQLRFQQSNITEAGERELTERLRRNWDEYRAQLDGLLRAPPGAAPASYFNRVVPSLDEVHRSTDAILAVNQDAMVRKSDRARRNAERMNGALTTATIAAFLFGILASSILTTRLVRPLFILSQAARRLGQGDLAVRAKIDGGDEIAQVARDFNAMADHLAEYRSSSLGELLHAQHAAQAAIDSLTDPVVVLSLQGAVLNANRAAADLLGLSDEGPADAVNALEPALRDQAKKLIEHVQSGRGGYTPKGLEEALPIDTRQGHRFLLLRANPVLGESGDVAGLTIVMQDVTRLRRFDELKNDLVATVAHEFRTPLTSLRMAIHLCLEETVGPLTPKQADLLYAAREDCERLQGIVDDLLDLSRIQAGRIEIQVRATQSRALIESAIELHKTQARDKGLTLEVGAPMFDRAVLADPERLSLVLSNLVTNAIRHTPPNGRVQLRSAPHGSSEVRFEVIDTGEGIEPKWFPTLFDRFFRIPGSKPGSGVGLGLYICKEIVEAHGGHIGVESDPGHGSIFWFTLPAATLTETSLA
ncbi:MAG: sensory box histidine kinase [bacterium]|nr:sensory box histidine kinase [bacterium]